MNIILFLLLNKFYWVESLTGYVYAEFSKPVREHSGFVCVEDNLKEVQKYKWDGKEFVLKPEMKVTTLKDSIKVEADSPKQTEITICEKSGIISPDSVTKTVKLNIDSKCPNSIAIK